MLRFKITQNFLILHYKIMCWQLPFCFNGRHAIACINSSTNRFDIFFFDWWHTTLNFHYSSLYFLHEHTKVCVGEGGPSKFILYRVCVYFFRGGGAPLCPLPPYYATCLINYRYYRSVNICCISTATFWRLGVSARGPRF